jgi:hypothetical protein
MSSLGHAQARETQRSAQLQGESRLSPGQAECGRKAPFRAGPRLTDRLPKIKPMGVVYNHLDIINAGARAFIPFKRLHNGPSDGI